MAATDGDVDRGLAAFADSLAELFLANDPRAAEKRAEAARIATLQTIFAALARGEFETAFAHLTPDTSYVLSAAGPIAFRMSGEGRTAVQDGMRNNFGAVDFERIDVDTVVAQGDLVVIIARQRGRWRASGVAFDERIMLEYLFAGAQVARYRGWILPSAA